MIRPWVLEIGALTRIPVDKSCKLGSGPTFSGTINSWWYTISPGWFVTVEMPQSRYVGAARVQRYANAIYTIAGRITDT